MFDYRALYEIQLQVSVDFLSAPDKLCIQLNQNLKKFWEIESASTTLETPVVRIEEQIASKKANQSFTYEQHMYRAGVPWKCNDPALPNNYKMTLQRLENTEKRLKRSPEIGKVKR